MNHLANFLTSLPHAPALIFIYLILCLHKQIFGWENLMAETFQDNGNRTFWSYIFCVYTLSVYHEASIYFLNLSSDCSFFHFSGILYVTSGDIQKVCSLKIPEFWPPSPLFALVRFRAPTPPLSSSYIWLELTLSPSISVLAKFREKKLVLVCLVELNVSFKKPQWNLYKVDTIGAWQKCSLYGDVRFIESPSKNQKSSKVNRNPLSAMTFQL